MQTFIAELVRWWDAHTTVDLIWLAIGLFAQLMFSMRFLLQWLASEKARKSIVPETFWYFSFAGGLLLLIYAIREVQPVFILGQAMGLVIYSRNIYLIWTAKRDAGIAAADAPFVPEGR